MICIQIIRKTKDKLMKKRKNGKAERKSYIIQQQKVLKFSKKLKFPLLGLAM